MRGVIAMMITDDSLYCPPLPLIWAHKPGDGTPASVIHKTYVRELWRERSASQRTMLIARFLSWPIIVLGATAYFTYHNGTAIRKRTGKTVWRQIIDQLSIAARHGILPPWYYMFELHREENLARAEDYLHRFETKNNLFFLLKKRVEKTNGRTLGNKALYASICAKHGVVTPPLVAIARDNRLTPPQDWDGTGPPTEEPALPDCDLFVKPLRGKGGRNTLRASFLGNGRFETSEGQALTRQELAEHLKQLSAKQPLLIQKRLTNHRYMLDLCANALCCVRTVTCKNRSGGFEVTNAAFRMALRDDTTVDGLHRGGLVSRVDLATGELGPATDLGFEPNIGWRETNPNSGAQIQGRVLPYWEELKAIALDAHAAFPYKVAVGWDIAITDTGPVVVEGNGAPCVDIIQRVDGPLGTERFGELLAYHVECALEA